MGGRETGCSRSHMMCDSLWGLVLFVLTCATTRVTHITNQLVVGWWVKTALKMAEWHDYVYSWLRPLQ
jgi:hypothetical protein